MASVIAGEKEKIMHHHSKIAGRCAVLPTLKSTFLRIFGTSVHD